MNIKRDIKQQQQQQKKKKKKKKKKVLFSNLVLFCKVVFTKRDKNGTYES